LIDWRKESSHQSRNTREPYKRVEASGLSCRGATRQLQSLK
jgi:hypothetical protein